MPLPRHALNTLPGKLRHQEKAGNPRMQSGRTSQSWVAAPHVSSVRVSELALSCRQVAKTNGGIVLACFFFESEFVRVSLLWWFVLVLCGILLLYRFAALAVWLARPGLCDACGLFKSQFLSRSLLPSSCVEVYCGFRSSS